MKRKQSWIFWAIFGGTAAVCLYYLDANLSEPEGARHAQRQRDTRLEIDHMCGEWKADAAKFSDCGQSYRYWRACEKVWREERERAEMGDVILM
jgi:hypothetical protein